MFKFDLTKPAKATFVTIINNRGNKQMDILKFTGNKRTYEENRQTYTEYEMDYSFGLIWVSELDILQ